MADLLALLSRFGVVGVMATLTYLVTANLLIAAGSIPIYASALGYLAGMVVSYVGQSRFTFQVRPSGERYMLRFCILSVVGLAVSYAVVWCAIAAGAPAFAGTLATAVLVPLLSFIAMKLWVFREPHHRRR